MKIVFFGVGSIAKKHIKILKKNNITNFLSYKSSYKSTYIKNINNIGELISEKPNVAFITNPTAAHIYTLLEIHKLNMNIFIEKPLTHKVSDFLKFKKKYLNYNKSIYIAYNQRFNPILIYLKEKFINKYKPLNIQINCNSNLLNWRDKKNSHNYYSANKAQGGGVLYDLSHEIDYTNYLFGNKKLNTNISIFSGKKSKTTIDSHDYAYLNFKINNCPILISLSYFTHKEQRSIKIEFEKFTITCDLITERIQKFINNKKVSVIKFKNTKKIMYEKQIEFFLNSLKKKKKINNVAESEDLIKNFF